MTGVPPSERNGGTAALIIGTGLARGALAATRALYAAGWTVGVGSPDPHSFAAASCASRSWHRVMRPHGELDDFVADVNNAVEEGGYDVILPSGDDTALALSSARDRIGALVPYGPHPAVLRGLDKLALMQSAAAAGLAVPRTALAGESADGFDPPVVVKPRSHVIPRRAGGISRVEARIATTQAEANRYRAEIEATGGEALFQELVRGKLLALATVADGDGRLVGTVQQEAERTWPPGAGITAHGRTVPVDLELADRAEALLRSLDWFGLAQLQFIAPERGEPCLLDLNGRFYGSLELAVASGSNLPAIWAGLATGTRTPDALPRSGVAYQWLEGDLRCAVSGRRGGIAGDLVGTLRRAPRSRHSMWSRRDHGPTLLYLLGLPRRTLVWAWSRIG